MRLLATVLLFALVACGDDSGPGGNGGEFSCEIVDLPVSGSPDAPLVTDVAIEAQPGDGIVVLATATDPQGDANLQDVPQVIRLFQDADCETSPIILTDDLVGSGVEESFGIAAAADSPLFSAIAAAESWPVELDFRDADGNATSAQVLARVIPMIGGSRQ